MLIVGYTVFCMGVLTEFFVATTEQAADAASSGPYGHEVPAMLAKSIDPVKVATLLRIIRGLADVDLNVADPVDVDRPEGPWLDVIHDEVTTAIAHLADDRISAVGTAWATTEEWHGAAASELIPMVRELRDLARQAHPPSHRLYLWMSL
jgi:hypothetical protein